MGSGAYSPQPVRSGGLWDLRPGPEGGAFPWTRPEVQELYRLLVDLAFREEGVIARVQAAGMAPGAIPWRGSMKPPAMNAPGVVASATGPAAAVDLPPSTPSVFLRSRPLP